MSDEKLIKDYNIDEQHGFVVVMITKVQCWLYHMTCCSSYSNNNDAQQIVQSVAICEH